VSLAPHALADVPSVVGTARHRRTRVLLAACAAAIAVVAVGVAVARDDTGVQVATTSPASREVPPTDLGAPDVQVFMRVEATDAEVETARAALEQSPDVARFAYLDHDAAYREFSAIFSCNPNLLHSVQPRNLPASFRVALADDGSVAGLRTTLDAIPSVETVEAATDPSSTTPAACSDTPPTLPTAGEPPADAAAARDAVVAAFTQAWDGSITFEQRRAAMQDFRDTDQLVDALDHARTGTGTMRAVVDDIAFLTPERAVVLFHLQLQGVGQRIESGEAVLQDGRWKVSRETVCGEAQRFGVACSG
jgi:FtsX extracellular domain